MLSPSDLSAWLDHLRPGEDVSDAVQEAIQDRVFPPPSHSFRLQVYVLLAFHALVMMFSLAGLTFRFRSGKAWFFAREQQGLLRPNTAIVTHALFALYSTWFILNAPFSALVAQASDAAFLSEMLCFIPLALALHIMTWATALGSTTSLAFLSPLPSSRIKRSPPCRAFINAIAICFAVLFVFSLIPSTVLTVLRRRNLLKKVSQVLIAAQAVGEAADQIGALTALLPQFEQLEEEGRKLFRAYEGVVSLYVGWGLCWLTIYLPSSIKLINALRLRRRRIRRSIKSLRTLDELVSSEAGSANGAELKLLSPVAHPSSSSRVNATAIVRSMNLSSASVKSPPSTPSKTIPSSLHNAAILASTTSPSPKPPSTGHPSETEQQFVLPASSPPSESTSALATRISLARLFAGRLLQGVGLSESPVQIGVLNERNHAPARKPVTALRIQEALEALVKTNRLLVTLGVQFVLVLSMFLSSLAFAVFVLSDHGQATLPSLYVTWTGFSYLIPALVSSTLFFLLSLRGPLADPPPPPDTFLPTSTGTYDEASATSPFKNSVQIPTFSTSDPAGRNYSRFSQPFGFAAGTPIIVPRSAPSVPSERHDSGNTESSSASSSFVAEGGFVGGAFGLGKPSLWALTHDRRHEFPEDAF